MPNSSLPGTRPESRIQYTNEQFLPRKTLKNKNKNKNKINYFRDMTLRQYLLGF
jgi:hypothetical protein